VRKQQRSECMGVDLLNVRGLKEIHSVGPVVMVNLMRFRKRSLDGDGTGWDAYLRYSALTVPMIKARGGTLLWTGDAKAVALGAEDANRWDYIALVYYPDVAAFHRHDDVRRLRDALRSAPHQWLRGARHHLYERSLQQVQALTGASTGKGRSLALPGSCAIPSSLPA